MFVYQDGKLYIRKDDDKIIGVNIDPFGVVKEVSGTQAKIGDKYKSLQMFEVKAKFNIVDGGYKFPKPKKKSTPKAKVEE